jgi:hypothetical protein
MANKCEGVLFFNLVNLILRKIEKIDRENKKE